MILRGLMALPLSAIDFLMIPHVLLSEIRANWYSGRARAEYIFISLALFSIGFTVHFAKT